MDKKECFYLGIIARKYSYKGEVVIAVDSDEPDLYANIDAVFVDINDKLIPFFIEQISLHKGNQLRIKFEDINNDEEVLDVLKRDTYLPLNLLPKLEGTKFYFHEIINFQVIDENYGLIGKITGVNDSTSQSLFIIESLNNGQILVPIIDKFIKKVDRENKKITVNTPKGLVQMNFEEE